jgi:hypothetical protein
MGERTASRTAAGNRAHRSGEGGAAEERMAERYVGIDVGAETLKVVELVREAGRLVWTRRHLAEHGKNPGPRLQDVLAGWGGPTWTEPR